ncbi:hypothetical protein V6N12_012620 [Hibiscus sabdariffa]|uniref:Uncharacterized protein n=1 Tax=Hibiscus sabdariffa TaxID=183260 RepID=A0ABR2DD50_9ROSI
MEEGVKNGNVVQNPEPVTGSSAQGLYDPWMVVANRRRIPMEQVVPRSQAANDVSMGGFRFATLGSDDNGEDVVELSRVEHVARREKDDHATISIVEPGFEVKLQDMKKDACMEPLSNDFDSGDAKALDHIEKIVQETPE